MRGVFFMENNSATMLDRPGEAGRTPINGSNRRRASEVYPEKDQYLQEKNN